jgi:hypothetical protein
MDSSVSVSVIVGALIVAAATLISPKLAEARCLVNCAHDGETNVGYDGYVRAYYGGGYYGRYYGGYPSAYYGRYSPSACSFPQRYVRGCYRY